MNRFTGNVWLVKTYVKQVGQLRVLAAREASVEPTQDMSGDANMPSVATSKIPPIVTQPWLSLWNQTKTS